ncbi:MAG: peptide ABC transporter substrate-binding protein, partial [Chloroflexi bacterium]|nr:peptide ABC transporter substrate-binding protein [Chloroflexota bacterium]
MSTKKVVFTLFALVAVVSMVAAQCAGAPSTKNIGKIDPKALPAKETLYAAIFGTGDIPTLDPSHAEDTTSIQMGIELFGGVTRLNEATGDVQPGMASEWKVSADGLVYTFILRKDIPWVHYDPNTGDVAVVKDEKGNPRYVTANDFVYGIKRTLDPKTASTYAYVNWIIKNAQAVSGGSEQADKNPLYGKLDEIGVKALDDYTLEITLNQPASFFLDIASMQINWAEPKWLIDEKGDKWTEAENIQSYGPYVLGNWTHDVSATLVANPFWPGIDSVPKPSIKYINFSMLDDSPSFANYEAGLADVSVVPITELDRVKADPTLSKELSINPDYCSYYYGFNTTKPPFDDANVRKAFSWAIDRQAIVDNVTKSGQVPARWFARPGLTAAPDPAKGDDFGPPPKADPAKAREFLATSKYGSADKLPEITLMTNQVERHVKIAEAIQQMWKENLGVSVNLVTQEWMVYMDTLNSDPPQVWRQDWCLDYPDADNFDRGVFRSDSGNNYTRFKSDKYDQIVDQAA